MRKFLLCAILLIAFFHKDTHAAESIFINTLPKSGSVYIYSTLCEGLKKSFCRISLNTFPEDIINIKNFKEFVKSNSLTQEHLNASERTIQLLEKYQVKFVLHVRDPRQALLSWAHHLNRYRLAPGLHDLYKPRVPRLYFTWKLEQQLDWLIENHFPHFVQWIADWLKVYKENRLQMKLMTYEHFHENPNQYFEEILDFYDIPLSAFSIPSIPKEVSTHYRKGMIDEWRDVFTLEQQRRVNELIPEELFSEFSWWK